RSLYRPDNQAETSDPTLLDLGELESLALPGESYKLAFTPRLLDSIFSPKISSGELNNLLSQEGKYVRLEGNWWIPSGRQAFDPAQFYLVSQIKDPFGQIYQTTYDTYRLLATQTVDPLGNTVRVRNNYRTLQPEEITNPNGNRAQVAFDALGMVAGTAVMGKFASTEGDSLANFETDLTQQQIDDFSLNPLSTAVSLLGNATTRIIYDLERYINTGEPVFAATLARETQVSDLVAGEESKVQVSFTYSDGFGREIQQKIQAEPGLAPVRDAQGVLRCNQTLQPTDPRWVGTGRTIFNNKSKPVKQYEPFFSPTHSYEDEADLVECGVTPILHYDPLARVIRTDLPNGTFSKVEFDPWYQETWDNNDTVLESQWYVDRGSPDPNAPEPTDRETRAAWLTAKHANTPTTVHLDVLGRTFLTIADNGTDASGLEQKYETRVELDIEGNQRSVTDALDRKVMVYDYDLLGNVIHQHSMEAGERWTINNVAGNPLRAWDSRGHSFRTAYDALRRPLKSYVKGINSHPSQEFLTERIVYGEQHPEAIARNLRGQLFLHFDRAGVVASEGFDFKGNLLTSSRRLAQEYKQTLDWSAIDAVIPSDATNTLSLPDLETAIAPLLESDHFTNSTTFDALNRPTTMTMPDDSLIRPGYNEANLLERVEVNLQGNPVTTNFVTNIDYDAKGQRTLVEYGNGVKTNYSYDRLTFRLIQLQSLRGTEALQNMAYTYDPVGNITHIQDQAQQTIYFRNQIVEPSNYYTYDAIYRLISATGREHLGQTGGQANALTATDAFNEFQTNLDHPGNGNAMGTYSKSYLYDAVGNILSMQHRGSNPAYPGWTRNYTYNETSLIEPTKQSNRLSNTRLTGNNPLVSPYLHDAHGNMIRMPHLANHSDTTAANMYWDYQDRLQQADLGGGGTAYYVYDAAGQRIRKIVEKSPGLSEERIYLGGFEVFRKRNGTGTITLERETLHVMHDQQRIALVETRTVDTANTDRAPAQLIRYQLGNHLGSASVELDEGGQVISYEEYYPYGSTSYQAVRSGVEVSSKRYRYTGKERDEETGLNYHGARYYALWLGRWSSCDPAGLIDGTNLFRYVRNNPNLWTDTSGNNPDLSDFQLEIPSWRSPVERLQDRLAGSLIPPLDQPYDEEPSLDLARYAQRILDLEGANVIFNRIIRSDLRDIAWSIGSRARHENQRGITIERSRGREVFYDISDIEDTILPVVSHLASRSQERGRRIAIASLFRPGNERSLHRHLRAVDLSAYGGHRIHETSPESSLRALEALLEDLPPGEYALGLPRLPRIRGQEQMEEDAAAGRGRIWGRYYVRRDYRIRDLRRRQSVYGTWLEPTEELLRLHRTSGEPFMAAPSPGRRIRASRVEEQIRSIRNPDTQQRVREAIDLARTRGVHIVGLFRDQSGHIHLSIPTDGRM
ncbi:MAG: RHS repeat domain-containing protein, partial [Xenococcus sp. (in: cyanobacteria)]